MRARETWTNPADTELTPCEGCRDERAGRRAQLWRCGVRGRPLRNVAGDVRTSKFDPVAVLEIDEPDTASRGDVNDESHLGGTPVSHPRRESSRVVVPTIVESSTPNK